MHAWFERVCFSLETYALLCGNCHVSKGKLFSLVIDSPGTRCLYFYSYGKRHVVQRKQTRENVCDLCLNVNSRMTKLKSLPLETWQFSHSNAYVSSEKHTRSNHACPSSIRNRSTLPWIYINLYRRLILYTYDHSNQLSLQQDISSQTRDPAQNQ